MEAVKNYHLNGLKYLSEVEIRYNAALNYVDTELNKFIEFLKENELWSNTFLFITADHGDNLVVNDKYIGHGGAHNRIMKVPFIIVGPDISKIRVKEFAQHIDLVPTVLDLFNIKTKYQYDGKSLLPLIRGEVKDWKKEAFFISSTAKKRYTLLNYRYKFNLQ